MDSRAEALEEELRCLLGRGSRREVALFGARNGFLNEDLRSRALDILLGVDFKSELKSAQEALDGVGTAEVPEATVIANDVIRSFNINQLVSDASPGEKAELRTELSAMLKGFFLGQEKAAYYQGFNSVAEVLLLAYGMDSGLVYLRRLAPIFFADFLAARDLKTPLETSARRITRLVTEETGEVLEPEQTLLTVGWTVTVFSHYLPDHDILWRIWDFLLGVKLSELGPFALAVEFGLDPLKIPSAQPQKLSLPEFAPLVDCLVSAVLIFLFTNRKEKASPDDPVPRYFKEDSLRRLDREAFEEIFKISIGLLFRLDSISA